MSIILPNGGRYDPFSEKRSWRYRMITGLRGNQTLLGTLFLAIINKRAKHPPNFANNGVITKDGYIVTHFQRKDGTILKNYAIGMVAGICNDFRRACDLAKMDDAEREEMFSEFRKWISRDLRAVPAPLK